MKYIIFLCFIIISCSDSGRQQDTCNVLEMELKLTYEQGVCVVSTNGENTQLPINGPCFFVRSSGDIQMFSYEESGVDGVIAIVGNPIDEATRNQWNLDKRTNCGSEVIGLVIKNKQIQVSENVMKEGVYCPEIGLDEKVFWSFVHDK